MLKRIWKAIRVRSVRLPISIYLRRETQAISGLVSLGTDYGGWTVKEDLLKGTAVCAGAGEDISFDIMLNAKYGMNTLVIDPTPRAIAHFEGVVAAIASGERFPINNGQEGTCYDLKKVDVPRLKLVKKALWSDSSKVKFFVPRIATHVSHSITNLNDTDEFIEVDADRLSNVLKEEGLQSVDLLKLDIEGAEGIVLKDAFESNVYPTQICIEFDEMMNPKADTKAKVKEMVGLLKKNGYRLAHFDGEANCLFLLNH